MQRQSVVIQPLYHLLGMLFCALVLLIVLPGKASASVNAIVNGEAAPQGEQPWMVGIAQAQISDGYAAQFCGGTLISAEWVLTAAHCTYDEAGVAFPATDLDVLVGRYRLSSAQGERIGVDQIVRNPAFEATTYRNDIALLHLSRPAKATPVHLALSMRSDLERPAVKAMVAGWGVTADGEATDVMQRAQLPLTSARACQTAYAQIGLSIDANTLCAGYAEGGIDACGGDSGGPLAVWDAQTQSWVQIGIISWGEGCAQAGLFGVYTRVASFTDWIVAITNTDASVRIVSSLNVAQRS